MRGVKHDNTIALDFFRFRAEEFSDRKADDRSNADFEHDCFSKQKNISLSNATH
jgi:hypothetical protein